MLIPGYNGEMTIPGDAVICKDPFAGDVCTELKDCNATC